MAQKLSESKLQAKGEKAQPCWRLCTSLTAPLGIDPKTMEDTPTGKMTKSALVLRPLQHPRKVLARNGGAHKITM